MTWRDAAGLEQALRRGVRGEVRFDPGSRALYATDSSNYRQVPIGVVLPRDSADVEAAVSACREFGAPLLPRGAGTSLAGQCCNVAVVLDLSRHVAGIVEIDPDHRQARVLPGTRLDVLREAAERHGLTFGPDPATHRWCTIGGMIGNNSCGVHSVMAGRTSDNVEALEVLTYDGTRMRVAAEGDAAAARDAAAGGRPGEIHARLRDLRNRTAALVRDRYPPIPRRVSGYNLDELLPERGFNVARALTGTEGTCALVLEATLRLVPSPGARALLVLGYPDVVAAADDVPEILERSPIGLEGIDDHIPANMIAKRLLSPDERWLPDGAGWLLVEFGGDGAAEAEAKARALMHALGRRKAGPAVELVRDPAHVAKLWEIRESGLGATARIPGKGDAWPGWEDAAVAPARLGAYLRELRALFEAHGYSYSMYGHFGDGCVHCRIDFDLATEPGVRRFRAFVGEAADLAVAHGGSLSGEHGDGQARAELLPKMFGHELVEAFREFKAIWDPGNRMNPGKVVDPRPITADLRLGEMPRPRSNLSFAEDDGDFSRAVLRCVGVGKCLKEGAGTMCPSYMATGEERHSTRGRARLLFEMLRGDAVTGGWRDEDVKGALDLCLSCKACKTECPANVDMAAYKAEFLSHYFQGRRRPRAAYAMGMIDRWARLASRAPAIANALGRTHALKSLAGVAPERRVPRLARRTFLDRFAARGPRNPGGPRVLLWPDTFNNFFRPATALAAAEVLEGAGFRVEVPPAALCCGRPLYDWGMLHRATASLRAILDALREPLRAGVPVIGLEPSCVAVFRDELLQLFPRDPDARRLAAQSMTLADLLERERVPLPRAERDAIVQRHCHQASVLGFAPEVRVLERMGVRAEVLDAGCCGMAGAFGFARETYAVSTAVGERALLPAVRAAPPETIVLADGFSCREQIEQATPRGTLHLAELIRRVAPDGGGLPARYPERAAQRSSRAAGGSPTT